MGGRTLLQFFHWYYPIGGKLWNEVREKADALAAMGVTDVWLPPAYKGASGPSSVGYDSYDLFDLGEFDQKGTIPTKYGSRSELEIATHALKRAGLRLIHDVVFDHKLGADEKERVQVRRANVEDRTQIEDHQFEASAYTRFVFPGRKGKYSQFIWDQKCFSGVDYLEDPEEWGVFRLMNEYGEGEWNVEVDQENGNFDYLMGADVEVRNKAVYEELKYWGRWLAEQLPVDGFRLDAAKHIPAWFFRDWVGHMRDSITSDLFVVAEYWHSDISILKQYLELVDRQLMLFDVTLHDRFHDASLQRGDFDLRTIFDGSLVAELPQHAVTLVENHDTQPLQALEWPVKPWFKPLAYALILLRDKGVPCVFYPDLYGAHYTGKDHEGSDVTVSISPIGCLPNLIEARKKFANGPQTDYLDDPHCIGFVRHGNGSEPGCVVVMTNGDDSQKTIDVGVEYSGAIFHDFLCHRDEEITVGSDGKAAFPTNAESVSVWVRCDRDSALDLQ